ncbi:hypothetical protein [Namhaeicola litoreus]|uniref:Uncharacterized protein n=1 Tax=Namhaeicola litoreus TaxID=1052145 RepID=A0ABW3Y1P7_9FLAO
MGIFWDLIQQDEIQKQKDKANSMEERMEYLEAELKATKELLRKTLMELEKHLVKDIDGDGKLG